MSTPPAPTALLRRLRVPAIVVVMAAVPFVATTFFVSTLTQILSFSLLVASVMVLMGQAGMPTLGQAVFLGVGGYAAGLLAIHVTTDALIGLLVAAVAGLVDDLLKCGGDDLLGLFWRNLVQLAEQTGRDVDADLAHTLGERAQ